MVLLSKERVKDILLCSLLGPQTEQKRPQKGRTYLFGEFDDDEYMSLVVLK